MEKKIIDYQMYWDENGKVFEFLFPNGSLELYKDKAEVLLKFFTEQGYYFNIIK